MQRRAKMVIAAAAAGLFATAVVGGAVAANRGHGGGHGYHGMGHGGWGGGHHGMGHGGWRGGHHRGKGMRHMIKNFAKRYDADKDGKISQEEIDTNRSDWHKKFDADSNGTISLKEFEALWLEAKRQKMIRAFQRLDADGDAQLTIDEYKEPMSDVVERWDRNGDGVLSREDRRHRRQGMRREMDQKGSTQSE